MLITNKGIELLTAKDLCKTQTKQEKLSTKGRVKFYKEQYKKAKADGYKGSSTSYAKNLGWVEKTMFYVSRIWKWIRHSQSHW